MTLPVVVIGLSHKTAPVDVRERFASGSEVLPEVLARITSRVEIEEAMFLSTCNRVEVLALPTAHATQEEAVQAASHAVREALREHIGAATVEELREYLYERSGEEAVRHVFRVASSLDSMVLGEPQILGQVKDAYDAAIAAGALRSHLARCVSRSFTVAKRIRTETQLGAGTVSISSVAVDLAKRIFGELADHTVLLVGAGEMAEQAAKSLGQQARAIRICNRSFDRAANLASHFNATAAPIEQLEAELVLSDVVVASTSSKNFVVTKDLVKRVMKQRKGRTLFFVDIAVPRNVEPAVHGLDNVYVYNVDDLEHEVAENMKSRQKEVAAAEKIVDVELTAWSQWARGLNVNPTIVALRAKTKGVLVAELERTLGTRLKHLPEGDRQALTQMIESATNKLLHAPTTRLKAAAGVSDGNDLVRAAQHLFDLPSAPAPEPSTPSLPPSADESEKRLPH
ncbi:MAG: glutamyl-tRNA reductase [Labilithrix sp.]|nr:glutamyl-tRNA reductase [Labilithrix sp.]MCW5817840.1 glutamyl-tRNA reductase [Labilithrix sp.]